jgi:hypothetical protein
MQERSSTVAQTSKTCSVFFDTTKIIEQLDELKRLLESRFPQGIPDKILSDLLGLSLDVVFTDSRTTSSADGTIKIVQGMRFGTCFERLGATILAFERDVHKGRSLSR